MYTEHIDEALELLHAQNELSTLLTEAAKFLRDSADRIDDLLANQAPILSPEQKAEAKRLAFDFVMKNAANA